MNSQNSVCLSNSLGFSHLQNEIYRLQDKIRNLENKIYSLENQLYNLTPSDQDNVSVFSNETVNTVDTVDTAENPV